MENDKLLEISKDPSLKSNKDLEEGLELLNDEFEKTKFAIVELTRHLDTVEKLYNKINEEIGNRVNR